MQVLVLFRQSTFHNHASLQPDVYGSLSIQNIITMVFKCVENHALCCMQRVFVTDMTGLE